MAAKDKACSICGDPVRAKGWCAMHYQRWYIHGDPLAAVRGYTKSTKDTKKRKRKKTNEQKDKDHYQYWMHKKSARKREKAFWKYMAHPERTADERYEAQLKRFDLQRAEQFRTNDFDESLYKPRFFPMRTLFQPSTRNLYNVGAEEYRESRGPLTQKEVRGVREELRLSLIHI